VVGIAWIGYDTPKSLGDHETGGGAALPIWIDYMAKILKNVPEASYTMPENMVAIQSNDKTEYYYQENSPSNAKSSGTPSFSE
jgi:penicillin-binding protein 1A